MYLCIIFLRPFQIPKIFLHHRRWVQLSQLLTGTWVSKLTFFFSFTQHSFIFSNAFPQAVVFVQFFDVAPSQDSVDHTLTCICLEWTSGGDHKLTASLVVVSTHPDLDSSILWLGLISMFPIFRSLHVLRQVWTAPRFGSHLHWRFHRPSLNRS